MCTKLGGDANELFMTVGLINHGTRSGSANVTYQQYTALLEASSRRLQCPDFGMRLALSQLKADIYGPLGKVMRHSQTFGGALRYVFKHPHLHSPAARITRHAIPHRKGIVVSHEILSGTFDSQHQAMEHILLVGHLGAITLTGGSTRARQVLFRHRPIAPLTTYRRNFGCEVLFDHPIDGLVFSNEDLENPIIGQNAQVHADAVAAASKRLCIAGPTIDAATRAAVLRLMQVGLASNTQVAAEVGMHVRTLHRRLMQAGTTFQRIKNEVRCELVRYYVAHTELSFLWITAKLDFAEQAVFTRFCRRHLGNTPTMLREIAAQRGWNQDPQHLPNCA